MSGRNNETPLWTARADEILADGEWHDGKTVMQEAAKLIPPGIAARKMEANRALNREAEGRDPDAPRKVEVPLSRLITMGKRSLTQKMLAIRLSSGRWEVRPEYPLPEGAWKDGGWEVRDAKVGYSTISDLTAVFHMSNEALLALILAEPALPHRTTGRVTRVHRDHLDELAVRVKVYEDERIERRAVGVRRRWKRLRENPPPQTRLAMSVVARRYRMSTDVARKVMEASPELGWQKAGSISYLPIEKIGEFEKLIGVTEDENGYYRMDASNRRVSLPHLLGQEGSNAYE